MHSLTSRSRVKRPHCCFLFQFPRVGTLYIPCLVSGIDLAAPDYTGFRILTGDCYKKKSDVTEMTRKTCYT